MKKIVALLLVVGMTMALAFGSSTLAVEKTGKLIVIDAGHQKKGNNGLEPIGPGSKTKKAKVSSGTYGKASKLAEYQLNLIVAKQLKVELEKRGYQVKMIRTVHNVNISNAQRAKLANKWGADAFIRIHANGSTNTKVKGALTMAPSSSNKYLSKALKQKSQKLSQKVISAFCKATGANNQGVYRTDEMTGINWCKVPVTIVEMGYMSNRTEDLLMATKKYQKKIVQGISNGIDSYFES